ncbi:MAG: DUF2156 domain-containing protein [Candidatus Eremiobacteraeota bacterium]|nr:DUF2156 domain-containing protein [Candidatus Eremiobacteraeota bacterium]
MTTLEKLLTRYGRNVHSFMALEPGLECWFSSDGEGVLAYADRGGYWVAVGGPLGPENSRLKLAREFARAARSHGRKVVFCGVSHHFQVALATDFDWLKIGEQPVWFPDQWDACLARNGKLRNRIRRCLKQGMEVGELEPRALDRCEVCRLLDEWQGNHGLPPMSFMAKVDLFGHQHCRFYLAARQRGRLVGLGVAVPVYGRGGWLLEDLMIEPGHPGLGEALIDEFMRVAAKRGASMVSLGLMPLVGLGSKRHPWLTGLMLLGRQGLRAFYDADGLRRFREKLGPHVREPVYLVTPQPLDFWALRAVLMAFAGGWLPAYVVKAVRRAFRRGLPRRMRGSAKVPGQRKRPLLCSRLRAGAPTVR